MSVLDDILVSVRADLTAREQQRPLDELKDLAARRPSPRSALGVLRSPGVHVIAEVKRSSPSRGRLAEIDDPAALARAYEAGGASVILSLIHI